MISRFTVFVLGGVTAILAYKPIRSAAKTVLGGAMKVGDTFTELAAEAREEMADQAAADRAARAAGAAQ